MSKALPASRSRLVLPDLDPIAIQTGLVVRKSAKFTPGGFLQTLLSSVITGKASLNQLAGNLKKRVAAPMTRQSFHERIGTCSTAFLMSVLGNLIAQRIHPAAAIHNRVIRRVIIEDASAQVMPKSNAAAFPAHGNHHGPTAGVKIDFAYDLLSGNIISHSLHLATEQDKTIGKNLLLEIRPGDLVLRDMGYFSLGEFDAIEASNAYWLTRLPLTTGVILENGKTLENHLKRSRRDIHDLGAIVGACGKKCRLIAVRATREVAAARRKNRREAAAEIGKTPCATGHLRDGWHLMLTNLAKEQADVRQLTAIYRARWAVEIQFRAWKQALNLGKALNRKSGEHHLQALVLAGMIAHQLGMKFAQLLGDEIGRAWLSYEKLYDQLVDHLITVIDFAAIAGFAPYAAHIKRDRRFRKSPIESGICALT